MSELERAKERVMRRMWILYRLLELDTPTRLIHVHLRLLGEAVLELKNLKRKHKDN